MSQFESRKIIKWKNIITEIKSSAGSFNDSYDIAEKTMKWKRGQ